MTLDIQPFDRDKLVVGLSTADMNRLDITYEEMDYENIETRRVIWQILDEVRRRTGYDIDPSGNLMIEATPVPNGGCILILTAHSGQCSTRISKTDSVRIFEFVNIDNLLDAMKLIGSDAFIAVYTDGNFYRAEINSALAESESRTLAEFGKSVGKSALESAETREYWTELKKSAAK